MIMPYEIFNFEVDEPQFFFLYRVIGQIVFDTAINYQIHKIGDKKRQQENIEQTESDA